MSGLCSVSQGFPINARLTPCPNLPHDSFSFCVLVVSSILSVFNLSVDSVLCQRSSLDGVFLILVRFSYCFLV